MRVESDKRVLVIDSHKSSSDVPANNLHWQNARLIADNLNADLIWSYPTVNDEIKSGYDAIVFVHASHYAYTDYAWVDASPSARLFYVTNEYNLGEPRTLWMAAKNGRRYTVIANHPAEISKVVKKYVDDWVIVNLNTLVFGQYRHTLKGAGCVYYGSYRDNRASYFKKYLSHVPLSTHVKNIPKFTSLGVFPMVTPRLDIQRGDLAKYSHSLYIEDTVTHDNYNFLANRFYEALNSDVVCLFDRSCERTVRLSSYPIVDDLFVDSGKDVLDRVASKVQWGADVLGTAAQERDDVIRSLRKIVLGDYPDWLLPQ